jgi:predicted transcriptional regulator
MDNKLQEVGLSKNESKIYLSLVELGRCTVKQISDATGIHRSNIYETLQKMAEKGLVSAVMVQGRKYYNSTKPESLFSLLEHKRAVLLQLLPDLTKLHDKHPDESEHTVDVYQGTQGLKQILNFMVQEGEPIYAFGIPANTADIMKYFIANFHEERVAKKIPIFQLYDDGAEERLKYLNSLPHTQVKLFKEGVRSPATTSIFGDYVTIWVWSKPEFCLLIKSKSMAQAYKQHFDVLWSMS